MLTYAYTLTPDSNGTYLIQYPDLPEGAAVSETEKARTPPKVSTPFCSCTSTPAALSPCPPMWVMDRSALAPCVPLRCCWPTRWCAKVYARLIWHAGSASTPQVDRLLELGHNSKMDAIEAACNELGKRLDVSLA